MAVVTTDLFAGYRCRQRLRRDARRQAQPRRPYRKLHKELLKLTPEELLRSKQQADLTFFNQGITFTVYGRNGRRPSASSRTTCCRGSSRPPTGTVIERGLTQRITALNLFLKDIYHEQRILQDGVVPRRRGLHVPALPPADDAA